MISVPSNNCIYKVFEWSQLQSCFSNFGAINFKWMIAVANICVTITFAELGSLTPVMFVRFHFPILKLF